MTEIPKRRFALEEKDLSVEANENNKLQKKKKIAFLKKFKRKLLKILPIYQQIKF